MPGARITIEQRDARAIPAALVASWIAGELTEFPAIVVTLDQRRIVLDIDAVAPGQHPRLAAVLSVALEESRFDGWFARPG